MNLHANIQAMDVRKWNWPDDMTFGRKAAKKYSDTNKEANPIRISNKEVEGKEVDGNIKVGPAEDESEEESQHHGAKAEVDTTSLTDAIMSFHRQIGVMALTLCRMEELLFLKDLRVLSSQLAKISQLQVLQEMQTGAHSNIFDYTYLI